MIFARLAAAVALLVTPAFSQSLTVLLHRAIYLEETAGDPDGAIKLYNQILSAGPDSRVWEAEAQYHLGICLMEKGDKALAARTFQTLMQKHPEETVLIARASVHYQEPLVGYSFTVPAGWSFHSRAPYGGGPGTCTDFLDPEESGQVTICAKGERYPAGSIDERLLAGEVAMVQLHKATHPDLSLRPGSPFAGSLGGQRSLTILADATERQERVTEWSTWVQSERTRCAVIAYVQASKLADFQARFTPILNSLRIP